MANFDVNSLLKQLQGGGVETLSKTTGADTAQVNTVLKDALPVLIGKMSDNASTKEGAASLNKALSGLSSLKQLYLFGNPLSQDQINELIAKLPNCQIY